MSGIVRLGAAAVTLAVPAELAPWFGRLCAADGGAPPGHGHVAITPAADGTLTVTADADPAETGFTPGDAIAAAWERISYLLLDRLGSGMAVHAACLRAGADVILLPGASGAGKSRLALWYHALGYTLGTDELVTLSHAEGGVAVDALGRPVILKDVADLAAVLPGAAVPAARTSTGLVAAFDCGWRDHAAARILVVVPRFVAGAPLKLEALSAAATATTLMRHCVNARNLADGGLGIAAQVGRTARAVRVTYGQTGQLGGTLDVLSRLLLGAGPHRGDIGALCDAFNTRAAPHAPPPASAASDSTQLAPPPPRPIALPTVARFPRRLTIGMATFDDYDGVYFTMQSIRMGHPGLAGALEFVIVDNNPGGPCGAALAALAAAVDGCRYIPRGAWSGTAVKNAVFEEASSPCVMCVDSHVLVEPGALTKLVERLEASPGCRDLIQGPMLGDDLQQMSTHMEPRWSGGMFGVWGSDPRGRDPAADGFDIPMHGMGLFACRRAAWAGYNPAFRGFGAEEGYIHEKTRRNGGRTLCYPFLRWAHRFGRPFGVPYVNRWEDRIRNYLIGFDELGLDTAEMETHFGAVLGTEIAARIFRETRAALGLGPASRATLQDAG